MLTLDRRMIYYQIFNRENSNYFPTDGPFADFFMFSKIFDFADNKSSRYVPDYNDVNIPDDYKYYFIPLDHIFRYFGHNIYIREVILKENIDFTKKINEFTDEQYILGESHELVNLETIKLLIDQGADIRIDNDNVFRYCVKNGKI